MYQADTEILRTSCRYLPIPVLTSERYTMKNFILDTNVLLHDPQALFKFQENNIIIPITVIEEVDRFKKDMNETGRNARQISRILDTMREKGYLATGIPLPGGGILRVEMFSEK
jgi:PhoH-like ATPase